MTPSALHRRRIFLSVAASLSAAAALAADLTVPSDFSIDIPAPGKLDIRTSPKNLPVYTFDDDAPGTSNCNGGCLGPWIPVIASAGAKPFGAWTLVPRQDQRQQWAYKGRALYTYWTDEPGKATGDGEQGKWHLLQP